MSDRNIEMMLWFILALAILDGAIIVGMFLTLRGN
jgi:hypothetical protein